MPYSIFRRSKISRFSITYCILVMLFSGCDQEPENNIPYVYVNTTVHLQGSLYIELINVGGSAFIPNVGYNRNGIVVYHSGIDEFKAFDRTCTFQVQDNCVVEKNENSVITVVCPCCDSKFELTYGTVSKGSASVPLREYQTSLEGDVLRIYN